MYTVLDYGLMATDPVRMDAYARAIARVVEPGSVVADLGSGSGVLSLLAARAGAARVYAIDVNPAVWVAREIAVENGLVNRIIVHEASSLDVTLPERVDVVLSDMRGSFPLHQDHLTLLHDAATRFLKPGGKLLPVEDRFMAGLVESNDLAARLSRGWGAFERHGLSASSARVATLNAAYADSISPLYANHLLTHGEPWFTVKYGEAPPPSVDGSVVLRVKRGGVAHAVAVWFEATIWADIGFDTAPGMLSAYARRVLPLAEPTAVDAGDLVDLTVRAGTRGNLWAWDTTVKDSSGAVKRSFRQSTFLGVPASPASLLRRSSTFRPERSVRGEQAARALALMDGSKSIGEIATALGPGGPPTPETLEQVRDLVGRYAR